MDKKNLQSRSELKCSSSMKSTYTVSQDDLKIAILLVLDLPPVQTAYHDVVWSFLAYICVNSRALTSAAASSSFQAFAIFSERGSSGFGAERSA